MNEPQESIHIYIVQEEEQLVVDSTVQNAMKKDTKPLVMQSHPWYSLIAPLSVIAANLSMFLAVFFMHIYPILTATATITIIPKSYRATVHITLSNVQSRIFQPLTFQQSKTVPATGHGHQHAQQARGTITLYNASVQEQTIDAGMLLIGSDGVHIVTDQAATIPGATPPIEGQAIVSAHPVNVGAVGNINAGDIRGACCRENIFVSNSPFRGGADERDYTMVTQEDIQQVVSSVVPTLTQHIHTSFQQQIHRDETITPPQCTQKNAQDRTVGDEATQVTVTVSESCLAGAYSKSDFQTKVQQALAQQATHAIGAGYVLSSYVNLSPLQTTFQQRRLLLSAVYQGEMIYHFSSHDLATVRQQLAGKSRQKGIAMLAHLKGVEHLSFQTGTNDRFPTDPTHIRIVFLIVSQEA